MKQLNFDKYLDKYHMNSHSGHVQASFNCKFKIDAAGILSFQLPRVVIVEPELRLGFFIICLKHICLSQ